MILIRVLASHRVVSLDLVLLVVVKAMEEGEEASQSSEALVRTDLKVGEVG